MFGVRSGNTTVCRTCTRLTGIRLMVMQERNPRSNSRWSHARACRTWKLCTHWAGVVQSAVASPEGIACVVDLAVHLRSGHSTAFIFHMSWQALACSCQ